MAAILAHRTHPETGRRACLGLMRMGETYGAVRLEEACGRAIVIKSPTYKSVEGLLKTGLDKVALTAEAEAKAVIHENIRGGAYFDREEVKTAEHGDDVEARYLAEERFAITNEPDADPAPEAPRSSRVVRCPEVLDAAALSTVSRGSRGAATEPIPVLIGRLQALWASPPAALRSRHRGMVERGGGASRDDVSVGSSCTSVSDCDAFPEKGRELLSAEEENRRRGDMCEEMRCVSDDGWDTVPGPHRGEV